MNICACLSMFQCAAEKCALLDERSKTENSDFPRNPLYICKGYLANLFAVARCITNWPTSPSMSRLVFPAILVLCPQYHRLSKKLGVLNAGVVYS